MDYDEYTKVSVDEKEGVVGLMGPDGPKVVTVEEYEKHTTDEGDDTEEETDDQEVYVCTHEGCEREFDSQRGRSSHEGQAH